MPKKEPKVLQEMEEKFSNYLGLPYHTRRSEPSNMSIEQLKSNILNPKMIEQDFRHFY